MRGLGVAILCVSGIYFLATLRDSHFNEWRPGADVKAAFPAVLDLCRHAGVREVAVDPNYSASLNFYRVLYQSSDLDEFHDLDKVPPGKAIYVLPADRYQDFIRTEGLQVAYHGPFTDLVVAVRPVQRP